MVIGPNVQNPGKSWKPVKRHFFPFRFLQFPVVLSLVVVPTSTVASVAHLPLLVHL